MARMDTPFVSLAYIIVTFIDITKLFIAYFCPIHKNRYQYYETSLISNFVYCIISFFIICRDNGTI